MEIATNQDEVNNDKKRKMRIAILQIERDNSNTRSKSDKEMIKQISDIIEREATSRY